MISASFYVLKQTLFLRHSCNILSCLNDNRQYELEIIFSVGGGEDLEGILLDSGFDCCCFIL